MNDDTTRRIPVEGVDPLVLTGVNDANLLALEAAAAVRASLRGDHLVLSGPPEAVDRAVVLVRRMIDTSKRDGALTTEDIDRFARNGGGTDTGAPVEDEPGIILPGVRRPVRPRTPGQAAYLQAMQHDEIVVGIGPAGTGKTYLAVAMAVDALGRRLVKRVVLARPAVEAGERLGFLPGDLQAKVDPYLRPLYDALEEMMPNGRAQRAIENRTIEIAPLAYMRGRTLHDAFVILDEAQNTTSGQMKMFLTRLGVNSRAVVVGDKTQVDLDRPAESGLMEIERLLPGIEGVSFCYLTERDVVRHRLVREIIEAYDGDRNHA